MVTTIIDDELTIKVAKSDDQVACISFRYRSFSGNGNSIAGTNNNNNEIQTV